ncbi:MAG TPA: energy transducer TonB [Pyrinomonadaceae bacterium]|nr:energy transducer TonB [Pyrinomonadaceae bacterium]
MKDLLNTIFICAVCFFAVHQNLAQTSDAKLSSPVTLSLSTEAVNAGIGGRVSVAVKVDAEGKVKDARMLGGPSWPCGTSPDSLLDEVRKMAAANIKQAIFTPAMKQGKAVRSDLVIYLDLDRIHRETEKRRAENAGESRPRWPIVGGVLNGKAKALPRPEYPAGARSMRITGPVTVHVLIGTDGMVKSAGTLTGHPQLADSARDAACAARFAPTTLEGKPIEVTGVLTYTFN